MLRAFLFRSDELGCDRRSAEERNGRREVSRTQARRTGRVVAFLAMPQLLVVLTSASASAASVAAPAEARVVMAPSAKVAAPAPATAPLAAPTTDNGPPTGLADSAALRRHGVWYAPAGTSRPCRRRCRCRKLTSPCPGRARCRRCCGSTAGCGSGFRRRISRRLWRSSFPAPAATVTPPNCRRFEEHFTARAITC